MDRQEAPRLRLPPTGPYHRGHCRRGGPGRLELILGQIGGELRVVRIESGAESTQFTDLTALRNFYETLIDRMRARAARKEGTSSGRMFRTRDPDIGGGLRG